MTARLTLEYIRQQFENEGHQLLTEEYINNAQRLDCVCTGGHKYDITWARFKAGRRCRYCYYDSLRLDIERVRQAFEAEGYILLTTRYINSSQKLKYICPNGYYHNIAWREWNSGQRCPCSYCDRRRYTIEFAKTVFEAEGYQLLSDVYVSGLDKLKYICPEGHRHKISLSSFLRGQRCYFCAQIVHGKKISGLGHPNWKGGLTIELYCPIWRDKEYKDNIKERDGYICLNPFCKRISEKLCLHHIDYDKKNCHPMNLITLCNSCNSLANFNREWYTAWYQRIIQIRYGIKQLTRGGAVVARQAHNLKVEGSSPSPANGEVNV